MTHSVDSVESLVSALRAIVRPVVDGGDILLRVSVDRSDDGTRTLLLEPIEKAE